MTRPCGIIKRSMQLVPDGYAKELKQFSKASLAEIAWDLAARLVGDENAHHEIFRQIRETDDILAYHRKK